MLAKHKTCDVSLKKNMFDSFLRLTDLPCQLLFGMYFLTLPIFAPRHNRQDVVVFKSYSVLLINFKLKMCLFLSCLQLLAHTAIFLVCGCRLNVYNGIFQTSFCTDLFTFFFAQTFSLAAFLSLQGQNQETLSALSVQITVF